MLARIPVILFGVPAVFFAVVHGGDFIRAVILVVISLTGQYELFKMFYSSEKTLPWIEWVSSFLIIFGATSGGASWLLICFAFSTCIAMIYTVVKGLEKNGTKRFKTALFGIFYLPFLLSFFQLIVHETNAFTMFVILASVWSLDIGAYLVGMSLRGPKLAPIISPKKSISGAVGGTVSVFLFYYLANNYGFLSINNYQVYLLAITIGIVGQFSDLFESVIKRESGVKDSGQILGAHGGVLDRIDSLLFLAPLCYAVLTI